VLLLSLVASQWDVFDRFIDDKVALVERIVMVIVNDFDEM